MQAGDHFYTTSAFERDNAYAFYTYIGEGIACYVLATGDPTTTHLLRLYNPTSGDHFYTTSQAEANQAIAVSGYVSEGTACFVYNSPIPDTIPLLRLYNKATGDHFYTTSPIEASSAVSIYGYQSEGISCYVFGESRSGNIPFFRLLRVNEMPSNPIAMPWGVLVCRFNDDINNPSTTKIKDLYSQWLARSGTTWIANNVRMASALDERTILEVYRDFFTNSGFGTYNAVKYWSDMSHKSIDISGSKIYPIVLPMTKAESASLATSLGGPAFWNEIFKRAKAAFKLQYSDDLSQFYALAVSFQSDDGGAQGGKYDGTPGVNMDIRYVIGNGMEVFGQEMGHAFGLDHSRQDGSNADYQDKWDTMSTWSPYALVADDNYGARGIGINAWNMRCRNWLDEKRIWKHAGSGDYSEIIQLRPLHQRNMPGFLGAEISGIGSDSNYLVEFRMSNIWDAGIPAPCIMVHRFSGAEENGQIYGAALIGQFFGTHSYVMEGTNGQLALNTGDVFEKGTGPFSRVKVLNIDVVNQVATVQLCYSVLPVIKPTVKINIVSFDSCFPAVTEGNICKFSFKFTNGKCASMYSILWSVSGAVSLAGQSNDKPYFEIEVPPAGSTFSVSVSLKLDDGVTVVDTFTASSISSEESSWREFICNIRKERLKPIPWWEWDPEKLINILPDYSKNQLVQVERDVERLLINLKNLNSRFTAK